MFIIDGTAYDVDIVIMPSFAESFEILSGKNSGRTQDGGMYIEQIGTYYNQSFTLKCRVSSRVELYDELYYTLSSPNNEHTVTMPHNQSWITFQAYISSGQRALERVENGVNYWGPIDVKFTAMDPQRRA